MRKLKRWFSGRLVCAVSLILIQLFLLGAFFLFLEKKVPNGRIILHMTSVLAVFVLLQKKMDSSVKLTWCILILMFPWIGGCFYFLFGWKKEKTAFQEPHLKMSCISQSTSLPKVLRYAEKYANGHLCDCTESSYFESGEKLKSVYLDELKKAEHFIMMEYFILDEGQFLSEILEVLKERIAHGVQVYLMYDDIGCIRTLPKDFPQRMRKLGIKVTVYNPLSGRLSLKFNTRNHRKITVIDNQTAFVGGNNLADEYVNSIKKFGYWKDTAVIMRGKAALHCARLFQSFWNKYAERKIEEDDFIPVQHFLSDGLVVPFSDDAQDEESAGLNVHLLMIQTAKTFVDIQTPYLILNDELKHALILACKSGIQVRIIVPHVPDRWFVHQMTRSFYPELLQAGVRIFEYCPGFIHSKVVLNDDTGLCGTVNMDYRSYVHHHECGVLFYQSTVLKQIREDILKTLDQCVEIHLKDCRKESVFIRVFRILMSLWIPVL